jgi:hypothetical protein
MRMMANTVPTPMYTFLPSSLAENSPPRRARLCRLSSYSSRTPAPRGRLARRLTPRPRSARSCQAQNLARHSTPDPRARPALVLVVALLLPSGTVRPSRQRRSHGAAELGPGRRAAAEARARKPLARPLPDSSAAASGWVIAVSERVETLPSARFERGFGRRWGGHRCLEVIPARRSS